MVFSSPAMFDKLLSKFQKAPESDHPLGSDANLAATLAAIPLSDPLRVLLDVDHWLDDIGRFEAEIGVPAIAAATLALDDRAHEARAELLERYLTPGQRDAFSESIWTALDKNLRLLLAACRFSLEAAARGAAQLPPADLARLTGRGLRAWCERKKLLRCRYRSADAEYWRSGHVLLALAGKLGLIADATALYEGESDRATPLQYYLAGVYFEVAPLANLVPHQLEVLHRLLLRLAPQLDLLPKPGPATTHWIDPTGSSGPRPYDEQTAVSAQARYISCRRLHAHVIRFAAECRKGAEPPDWAVSSGATAEQARRLGMMLLVHWADHPPTRQTDRRALAEPLLAVIGFALARRMIACSNFARMGKSLDYEGTDIDALFDASRFGRVDTIRAAEDTTAESEQPSVINPLETLERLELAGDRQMMERWQQVDGSPTGIGIVAPALGRKHRVGELACVRFADGLEWRLGIIRRIGRDAQGNASIGLQSLPWPSTCALVKPLAAKAGTVWNQVADAGGHGYADAILIADDGDELIMPRDMFAAELDCAIKTANGRRTIRLIELLDRGDDYDRIRFTPIQPIAQESRS